MAKAKKVKKEPAGRLILNEYHCSTPAELSEAFESFISEIGVEFGKYSEEGGEVLDPGFNGWVPPRAKVYDVPLPFEVTKKLRKLFFDLKKAFNKTEERARLEGVKEGQNLLFQLHKGDITLNDLDNELKKK